MRRFAIMTAICAGLAAAPASANMHTSSAHAPGGDVRVDISHTEILRLAQPASSVVVGNPAVADIAVHSPDTLLVLGRTYGTTNLIAMDAMGRVIAEHQIRVGARDYPGRLQVYNGTKRYTYDCAPECLIAPEVGDAAEHYSLATANERAISNNFASDGGALSSGAVPVDATGAVPPGVVGSAGSGAPDFGQ